MREGPDIVEIGDEYMIATIDGQIVATAPWSWHAAADGKGAWIASTQATRCSGNDGTAQPLLSDGLVDVPHIGFA